MASRWMSYGRILGGAAAVVLAVTTVGGGGATVAEAVGPRGKVRAAEKGVLRPVVLKPVHVGASRAVSTLPTVAAQAPDPNVLLEIPVVPPRRKAPPAPGGAGYSLGLADDAAAGGAPRRHTLMSADGALAPRVSAMAMPAVATSFEGINQRTQGNVSGFFVNPPDTVGDVGPNHYVECVNLACQVFDKAGASVAGPFTITSLYFSAAFPGDCAATNDGDPIVLYDPLADRWLISQFAISSRPPSHECIAISQTANPAGAYHLYDFSIPDNYFNDYPKLGVWPDAYYMTAPLFEGPVFGQGVFVLNRAKMLAGDATAEMVFFDLTLAEPGLGRILPADVDGPAPPPGAPNLMLGLTADEYGDLQDGIRLFEVKANWVNPAATTLQEIAFPGGSLAVAAYDPTFTEVSGNCGFAFTSRDDIEQPPPANCGMRVDSLSGRPMHRLAYRNFGTYESLIANHTVDVNATAPGATSGHLAGIRYYELRRALPGGTWAVQEQATYSPDATHRWMGSAAMDAQGNLAVGYSVSSLTVFPGVRYAGRLASDPPGGLFQGEATIIAGTASQTTTNSRWGDYSAMSVDPTDDCTFWYTQEYYSSTPPASCSTTACWQTRVASFKFPTCTSTTATGTLQGTVTDVNTTLPIAGALVQANGYSDTTDGAGFYQMTVPAGSYSVTASATGYAAVTVNGVVVIASAVSSQNFALGSGSIAGTITDSATTLPIPNATITLSNGTVLTTNGSGAYIVFPGAGTYSVTASKTGYSAETQGGVSVGSGGTTTVDLALDPGPILAVTASSVNDSGGNNNGVIDLDECFSLTVTVTNNGTVAATGITATLTTTTPQVSILSGSSAYPDIPVAGTGTNTTPFQLGVTSLFQIGRPIDLVLAVNAAGSPFVLPFQVLTGGTPASLTVSATGPIAIPDNNGLGAYLDVPVAGFVGTLSKVVVGLRITHTFDGDLILRVIAPNGDSVLLAYQIGGAGVGFGTNCPADGNDTAFDDAAGTSIVAGAAPFVGSYRPQEPLWAFAGKLAAQVNGTWRIQVVDIGPADVGNIECSRLEFSSAAAPQGCLTPDADAGGPYAVSENGSLGLSGSGNDVDGTIVLYEWDLDNDASFGETGGGAARGDELGAAPTFSAAGLDGPGAFPVSLRVTDDDGFVSPVDGASVTINNVAPTVDIGGPYSGYANVLAALSGSATDPAGALDPLTFEWDLDNDGNYGEVGAAALRGDELGPDVTFNPAGLADGSLHPLSLRVSDGDGGITTAAAEFQVLRPIPALTWVGRAALVVLLLALAFVALRRGAM